MKWLLVIALLLMGCIDTTVERTITPHKIGGWQISQVTIEGCEYLVIAKSMTHKGNCKNEIHNCH